MVLAPSSPPGFLFLPHSVLVSTRLDLPGFHPHYVCTARWGWRAPTPDRPRAPPIGRSLAAAAAVGDAPIEGERHVLVFAEIRAEFVLD